MTDMNSFDGLSAGNEPLFDTPEDPIPDTPAPEAAQKAEEATQERTFDEEECQELEELLKRCLGKMRRLEEREAKLREDEQRRFRISRKAAKPAAFFRGIGAAFLALPFLALLLGLLRNLLIWLRLLLGVSTETYLLGWVFLAAGICILLLARPLGRIYITLTDCWEDDLG